MGRPAIEGESPVFCLLYTSKLFRKNIEPRCAYCARGARIDDGHVACVKRGVVADTDK